MDKHMTTSSKRDNDKGFTLVELLIVIVILGILATVTVFAVGGVTSKGQKEVCRTDRATVETAADTFLAQYSLTAIPITGATGTPTGVVLGATPVATLVASKMIKAASTSVTVAADGVVTYSAACTAAGA